MHDDRDAQCEKAHILGERARINAETARMTGQKTTAMSRVRAKRERELIEPASSWPAGG